MTIHIPVLIFYILGGVVALVIASCALLGLILAYSMRGMRRWFGW